jgi:hypothetical protein
MADDSADPIGDALRADAEAALAEIRATGLTCPSCGVNMADLPESHMLTLLTRGREYEDAPLKAPTAQCDRGPLVHLNGFEAIKAAANISLWDNFRKAEDEAFAAIIGTPAPGHEYTGLLDVLGDQP